MNDVGQASNKENNRNGRTAQQWATYFVLTYAIKTREIQFPFREMELNHA
jgi:predicted AAA+ superfamily ATPase